MSSPITDSLAGQPVSPAMQDATQQQTVQRILERAPSAAGVGVSGTASEVRREELVKASQQVNSALRPYNVQFEVAEDSDQLITRIVDQETGELIRQIPAEAVLEIAARLDEVQGLLLNQQA